MFIFLSKLLPLLVYPAGLTCMLLLAALLLRRRPRVAWTLAALALVILWLSSTRLVAFPLVRSLEQRYLPPATYPSVDTAVVLGGATRFAGAPRTVTEVNEAGDRLIHAAWLYRNGYARRLLLTGGGIAWRRPAGVPSEAQGMADLLQMLGVPETAVVLEPDSRNTYENAVYTAAILPPETAGPILLVTSAMHMPRAVRLYEQQGYEVIPAPTDFLVTDAEWAFMRNAPLPDQLINLFPSPVSLSFTTEALREYLGLLVYALRGWI